MKTEKELCYELLGLCKETFQMFTKDSLDLAKRILTAEQDFNKIFSDKESIVRPSINDPEKFNKTLDKGPVDDLLKGRDPLNPNDKKQSKVPPLPIDDFPNY